MFVPGNGEGDKPFLNPYEGNKFSGEALVQLMPYDNLAQADYDGRTVQQQYNLDNHFPVGAQEQLDWECGREKFRADLFNGGPGSRTDARNYKSNINSGTASTYMTFNGGVGRTIRPKQAGVLAICYCGRVTADGLCGQGRWLFAGRIMIRGPKVGQTWVFHTGVILKLQMEGWGFAEDNGIRIIKNTSSCTDNSNSPATETTFLVNCPTGCRASTANEDIGVSVAKAGLSATDWDATNAYISGARRSGDSHSVLEFKSSIEGILTSGDLIMLDLDDININNKGKGQMEVSELYDLYKLAGQHEFLDDIKDTGVAHTARGKYLFGHTVQPVATNKQEVTIPVSWPKRSDNTYAISTFTFQTNAKWIRHNKLDTAEVIRGETATPGPADGSQGMKVCWGHKDGTSVKYHTEVGRMQFIEPPKMKEAYVSYTTTQKGATAPIIISFKTGSQHLHKPKSEVGLTYLRIHFRDITKILPQKVGDTPPSGASPGEIGGNEEKTVKNSQQVLCGKMFLELWSKHSQGFPVPHGCGYSKKRSETLNGVTRTWREYYIVFSEGNGLRQDTEYQMVFLAKPSEAVLNSVVADLYTGGSCTNRWECTKPYHVFEKGQAKSLYNLQDMGGSTDPKFADVGGFDIQLANPEDGVLDLTTLTTFQVQLKAANAQRAILRDMYLRIYFWPLTLWDFGTEKCQSKCLPYSTAELTKVCEKGNLKLNCQFDAVVGLNSISLNVSAKQRNVIKLRFPSSMDPITSDITHTINIQNLKLPPQGFFPTRVGTQLTRSDDTMPTYATSQGFVFRKANPSASLSMIAARGDLNAGPKPYRSNFDNVLIVRLVLGATIWNGGDPDTTDTTLTIKLPSETKDGSTSQYSCSVPDGTVSPSDEIFSIDEDGDGYPDYANGQLNAIDSGDWTGSGGRDCIYTLKPYQAIFAGSSVFVKITVTNPPEALSKTSLANQWSVLLQGKGIFDLAFSTYANGPFNFIPLKEENDPQYKGKWLSNVVVLSDMKSYGIQPSVFSVGATHFVHVFFEPAQTVPRGGSVIVDAPEGFSFGQPPVGGVKSKNYPGYTLCICKDLEDKYYSTTTLVDGGLDKQTHRLPMFVSCKGKDRKQSGTHNRAEITVAAMIRKQTRYGFRVEVTNPAALTYDPEKPQTWAIYTFTKDGHPVDGTQTTTTGWGLYNRGLHATPSGNTSISHSYLAMNVSNLQPYSIREKLAWVDIFVGPFEEDLTGHLRFIAPVMSTGYGALTGFAWKTSAWLSNGGLKSGEDLPDTALAGWPNVTEDAGAGVERLLPGLFETGMGVPSHTPTKTINSVENVLSTKSPVKLKKGIKYRLVCALQVPDASSKGCTHSIFVEFGYKSTKMKDRHFGAQLPLPAVQALEDVQVKVRTSVGSSFLPQGSLEGQEPNRLMITFRTATDLKNGAGIVIRGDVGTENFVVVCEYPPPQMQGIGLLLAPDVECTRGYTSLRPEIHIWAGTSGIKAGLYSFEMQVKNPPLAYTQKITLETGEVTRPAPTRWAFYSYDDLQAEKNFQVASGQKEWRTGTVLDKHMFIEKPYVYTRMAQGKLEDPVYSVTAGGRDDRPLHENHVVISFSLADTASKGGSDLVLTAPLGYKFQEDCLADVVIDRSKVFGLPVPAATTAYIKTFKDWPSGLEPTDCIGGANVARLKIPDSTDLKRFEKDDVHIFRIRVINPKYTPPRGQDLRKPAENNDWASLESIWNTWTVEFAGQATKPFPGFRLWTLQSVGLDVATTALAGASGVPNTARFSMTVFSAIEAKPFPETPGKLRITAPAGFEFVTTGDDYECGATLMQVLPDGKEMPVGNPGDVKCFAPPAAFKLTTTTTTTTTATNATASNATTTSDKGNGKGAGSRRLAAPTPELTLSLQGTGWSLQAGSTYALTFQVKNPKTKLEAGPTPWRIETFSPEGELLDVTTHAGFAMNLALQTFGIINPTQERRGNTVSKGVEVYMGFFEDVIPGQVIQVHGPGASDMRGTNPPSCNNFKWHSASGDLSELPTELQKFYSSNTPTCFCASSGQCTLQIVVSDTGGEWPKIMGTAMSFKVDVLNPENNPTEMEKFWKIEHYGKNGKLRASDFFPLEARYHPQLTGVRISLVGPLFAAGAFSSLEVRFKAVNNADAVRVQALEPFGFNFEMVAVEGDVKLEETAATEVLVTANIVPGRLVKFSLMGVRLGFGGGPTIFNIITYKGKERQQALDEKMNFEAFKLPGKITIEPSGKALRSIYREVQSGPAHAVKANLDPRLNEFARAYFRLNLSLPVPAMQVLNITSASVADADGRKPKPYSLFMEEIKFCKLGERKEKPAVRVLQEKNSTVNGTDAPANATAEAVAAEPPEEREEKVQPVYGVAVGGCDECIGGCIVQGMCQTKDWYTGLPATHLVCKFYGGTYCPGPSDLPFLYNEPVASEPRDEFTFDDCEKPVPFEATLQGSSVIIYLLGPQPECAKAQCAGGCLFQGGCKPDVTQVQCDEHGGTWCSEEKQIALEENAEYMVSFWTIPQPGENVWSFRTSDLNDKATDLPTTTNDMLTDMFMPVKRLDFTVDASRRAPTAIINATVRVRTEDMEELPLHEILFLGPPGFLLDEGWTKSRVSQECPWSDQNKECVGVKQDWWRATNRMSDLAVRDLGVDSLPEFITIQVQLPKKTPSEISWFAEGRQITPYGTKVLGWAMNEGFEVQQMPVIVSYAGVSEIQKVQMSFLFTIDIDIQSDPLSEMVAQILLEVPTGFRLSCQNNRAMDQVSLPGPPPNCTTSKSGVTLSPYLAPHLEAPDGRFLALSLYEAMHAGSYAFVVAADVPKATPMNNEFNLVVTNAKGEVLSGHYGFQGKPIHNIFVREPMLSWAGEEPGGMSKITLGFEVMQPLKGVKALLVNFPDGIKQHIKVPHHLMNVNENLPLRCTGKCPTADASQWADYSNPSMLKLLLKDEEIPPGVYKFLWEVTLPEDKMPANNVWYLNLCRNSLCLGPQDDEAFVLVSFSMAGFKLGQRMADKYGVPSRSSGAYVPSSEEGFVQQDQVDGAYFHAFSALLVITLVLLQL
eukprot:gnl/MRDRNA2_/MRDRNA2_78248_c1_seq1.p1 gnl/MRDRNA2_/MRDRNA2_78248_c1~~gnl/MRDRNA2_/MRDRNA2_78248_c1_seq1.p1  ORF type:complete len:3328 (+),score=541.16 gnl/MRDRNA2_/MRDRNA2_78248_c1_seq1:874-9984(+)